MRTFAFDSPLQPVLLAEAQGVAGPSRGEVPLEQLGDLVVNLQSFFSRALALHW